MPERLLVVLTGPVGGGKSTVAAAVAKRSRASGRPAAVIDLDVVYRMVRQRDDYADGGTWRTARRGAAALGDVFFDEGARVVVVEGGFFTEDECDELRDHTTSRPALRLVALNVSFEEALRRVQADPDPGRVVTRDPDTLRALHAHFTDALPFLHERGLVVDADGSSPDELAELICDSVRSAEGRTVLSVHFVRHGKRERRPGDPPLTREGRRDAERVAEHLVAEGAAAVFTSPLTRARETAEIIARALGLDLTEDPRLRERMNWGDLGDQSLEEFLAEWERCSRHRDRRPPGGDSSREAGARVTSFVADCWEESHDSDVIAVTHGGVLGDFLLNVFSGDELHAVRPEFCVDPYSGDVVRECSITTVTYDDGRFDLRGIGTG